MCTQHDSNCRFSQFTHNFIPRLKFYIKGAKILSLLRVTVVSGQNIYTSFTWQRHLLHSDSHELIFHADIQPFLRYFRPLSDIIHSYITTFSLLTTPVYYKLKNKPCANEYSVHKMNPDIG